MCKHSLHPHNNCFINDFIIYINKLYAIYDMYIPLQNDSLLYKHKLIDVFSDIDKRRKIADIKYMQHFNLRDAAAWLKNKVFTNRNISISADIDLKNLNDYVNGDLAGFCISITDTVAGQTRYVNGLHLTYLMNIDKICIEALFEASNNDNGGAPNTANTYNAFIYLNNVNGDQL